MATHALAGGGLVAICLGTGMFGYHSFEKMGWTDAFVNAAMILSGMGPVTELHTQGGKIFAGCYALFSGLAFIVLIGLILTPAIHRFLHKFHQEEYKSPRK
ncbi:MAG TPA: hypothetical protein VFC44_17395 [Candidatus Saccharimonadales bacterium]|nr:hypothetical protein [Candidatus Saccharimonadales bacterium]